MIVLKFVISVVGGQGDYWPHGAERHSNATGQQAPSSLLNVPSWTYCAVPHQAFAGRVLWNRLWPLCSTHYNSSLRLWILTFIQITPSPCFTRFLKFNRPCQFTPLLNFTFPRSLWRPSASFVYIYWRFFFFPYGNIIFYLRQLRLGTQLGRKTRTWCTHKISVSNSEIIPTRCNNCVYSSQWLYSTCFGWQFHPSSGVQCCIWPFR